MDAISRDGAWVLFCEWTESDSLRKHALAVEAGMRAYARRYEEDEELWAVTALVHDLDYERYPDLETGHPRHALKELERLGYPQEVIDRSPATPTSWRFRARRRWRRRSTPSTRCPVSSPPAHWCARPASRG